MGTDLFNQTVRLTRHWLDFCEGVGILTEKGVSGDRGGLVNIFFTNEVYRYTLFSDFLFRILFYLEVSLNWNYWLKVSFFFEIWDFFTYLCRIFNLRNYLVLF